ncbi:MULTISPECIES: XdhC family protein [unclassified Halanaerobium]|uniref:XdhC family protein n=1 Tax=unclassified Halanaerobium TaxID=2641197 RepID=UPI000DF37630|nr:MULTISPECIES: XdhC family protein [unclassified Halanaerobium]RCW47386.1 putative sulfurylase small subunit (molybdopterin cytosine dinucleotide biosynthesis) [Halanaerobium sp. MA284_MarDTE_T2]RCW84925.1 putative sulfurylase small subunit (molybdopterin cytosine dinucleotide biosynthesis) [Halanaerobium sp. DL-01]
MNKELFEKIINYSGEKLVLAAVIKTKDSSPRNAGAKMIIYPDGSTYGTIGGGPVEAEIIEESKKLIKTGGSKKLNYNLTNKDIAEHGGICGGNVDIFVEVIDLID